MSPTQKYQRPKIEAPSAIHRYERPPEGVEDVRLHVDGHEVPYIRGSSWISTSLPGAVASTLAEQLDDRVPNLRDALERGEPIYNLTLDDRFGITASESEIERWAWFLANAMAVAAGYTSHGEGSRPINRHGPSRV